MVQKVQDECKFSSSLKMIFLRNQGIDNVVIRRQEQQKYIFTSKLLKDEWAKRFLGNYNNKRKERRKGDEYVLWCEIDEI